MPYKVDFTPEARRNLRRLPPQDLARLEPSIEALGDDPRPSGVRKIRGQLHTWRIRIGPFRVIYDIDDELALVVVLRVVRRSESTYRRQ